MQIPFHPLNELIEKQFAKCYKMTSEERAKIITDYLKGRAEWLQKQSYHNIKDDLIDQAFELSEEKSMRGEIENMLKEFIPLSANYCVEDLTSAILEAIKKRVPKKMKWSCGYQHQDCYDAERRGYNECIDDFTKGLE